MKYDWQKNLGFGVMLLVIFLLYKFLDKDILIVFIKQVLPADVGGLFLGIVMGEKRALTKYWYEIFRQVGVLHVVVASGINLSILAKVVIDGMAGMVGRKRAIVLGLMLVGVYIKLIGFEAPLARAFIIFIIFYWAQFLGRRFNLMTAIFMMLFVLLIVDLDIFKEVSFWLSLAAFVAVASFGGIKERFFKKKKGRTGLDLSVLAVFGLNFWISLWIWPITAKMFGEINWLSIFINPLLLFGVEAIFCLGILIMPIYIVWPWVAKSLLMLAIPFLEYFLAMTSFVAGLNIGVIEIEINWMVVGGWYMILFWFLVKNVGANHDSPKKEIRAIRESPVQKG